MFSLARHFYAGNMHDCDAMAVTVKCRQSMLDIIEQKVVQCGSILQERMVIRQQLWRSVLMEDSCQEHQQRESAQADESAVQSRHIHLAKAQIRLNNEGCWARNRASNDIP